MKIIAGLGNPGEKYKLTRHNVGFMALDAIVKKLDLTWQNNKKFNALVTSLHPSPCSCPERSRRKGEGERERRQTILVKPQTFMNNSGQAVCAILSYYKLLPKKLGIFTSRDSDLSNMLTVIHDDIDIELGKYKISADSRSAGHKGVQSIINHLKTKNFKRIRIGIRTETVSQIPADKFVLQKFNEGELKIINILIPELKKELK